MSAHPAYGEGQRARFAGKPAHENPYPLSTSASRAWAKGWREMDDKLGSTKA
jgi:ribosome modulation factor